MSILSYKNAGQKDKILFLIFVFLSFEFQFIFQLLSTAPVASSSYWRV